MKNTQAPTPQDSLGRLSELAGILPDYRDGQGRRHATGDPTRRALLAAMGIDCGDAAATEAALHAWVAATWREHLPPVQVAPAGEPVRVVLRLPARHAAQTGHWRLLLEDGGEGGAGSLQAHGLVPLEQADVDGEAWQAWGLDLPPARAPGYHRLEVSLAGETFAMPLILHPPTCFQPTAVQGAHRVWGLAAQLYGVRSSRNWGVGDFTDLRHLVEWAGDVGAGIVGLNPLHALVPHDPRQVSPYRPSSRRFLNVLHLDVEAVPDFGDCGAAREAVAAPEFQARLRALRAASLVDYAGVAQAKLGVLELLYRHFRDHHLTPGDPRGQAFRDFQARGGAALERFALYHAAQEHLAAQASDGRGWQAWPEAWRDADSAALAGFAAEARERVEWHQYLQWLAEEQLDAAGWRALELGLGLGLCQDLAPGAAAGGAETWSERELYAIEARIGCPPDDEHPDGQDWGLTPWIPHRLRAAAYAPFIAALRANMRHAGALRIDRIGGLARQWWRPPGEPDLPGAHVAYPMADLLGILALESQRNQCLVVGEGLDTLAPEQRAAMDGLGMLDSRRFQFERDADGGYLPPARYPEQALVATGDHDLPTLAGFWRGTDLDLHGALYLFASEEARAARIVGRAEDRARLLVALEREGLLPEGLGVHPVSVPEMTPALARAVQRYLARGPAKIVLVRAEDMLGEPEQTNLPGSADQHPNWQRKLSLNLEEWTDDPRIAALAETLVAERGRAVMPHAPTPFPLRPVRAPRATYRLQLNRDFDFRAARELVPYLAELGVSHCYCSPYLQARPGSGHGYDITDHARLNPEIGGQEDLEAFCQALAEHGMGQILDMVPNHMGIMGADNRWWLDVLENGEASAYAEYFDIDWNPVKAVLRGRVLVPVLGDHYGNVLERGELRLAFDADAGEFSIWYYEHRFPVDPREYPRILNLRIDALGTRLGEADALYLEYQSLATAFSHLPARDENEPEKRVERARDEAIHKRHLADLLGRGPDLRQFLGENLEAFNGQPGDPASFDALHELILAQAYRLAYWRVASDEINYRRFFDINDLAALRMEREEVFEATHGLVFQLLQRGLLQGLRIDHADGLFAPAAYFERLQRLYLEACPTARAGLYVVVEKILAHHERLRDDWAVSGTTGYETANLINGVFVDAAAAPALERVWRGFTREHQAFDETLYQAKRIIMKSALASELNVLANRLSRIAERDRHTRDYTLNSLRTTLMEIVACFPVYRTYICAGALSEEDRRHVEWACSVAKKRARQADTSVYDFVREVLLGSIAEGKNEAYRGAVLDFGMRFQQFTSPVLAKGMEDTTFYRYFPLASVNEVGGDPHRMGVSLAAFHHANLERARQHPHTLLAGSTHDAKRSEDVRARINVLSEMPERWRQLLTRWHRVNRARFGLAEGATIPARRDEYLLYQTLAGTWPELAAEHPDYAAYVARIGAYMVKAVREAKEHSSWINPDAAYEAQILRFVADLLTPGSRFLREFAPFATELAHFGRVNSLAQTLLRLTLPGVPDLYQGCELWDLSLVDPDNRRPVDYGLRRRRLGELRRHAAGAGLASFCRQLLAQAASGDVKLHVIHTALQLRKTRSTLFSAGDYQALAAEGERAAHVCAYARLHGGTGCVVIAPRLPYTLLEGQEAWPLGEAVWGDTRVPLPLAAGGWRNLLSGERIALTGRAVQTMPLRRALAAFPLALLVPETEPARH